MLISYPIFGQLKTDLVKDKLFGKVKSIHKFKIEYGEKTDSVLISKEYFNENGMKLKYINFSKSTKFDSIANTFDKKNRKLSKNEYTRSGNFNSIYREKFIETLFYQYNEKCDKPIVTKDSNSSYKVINKFDENCNLISETIIDKEKEKSTTFILDKKARITKKTFGYLNEKLDLVETFAFDDKNNTLTNIQFSPKNNVYYIKEVTEFNTKNKIIQVTTFQQEILKNGILFAAESPNLPDNITKIIQYDYDNNDNLISEINFDGKNNELLKVNYLYDDKGELKEEKLFKEKKLEYRKEYKYENGKLLEEMQFLTNKKKPEYTKTFKYNDKKQIIKLLQLIDQDKYSTEYVYDSFNNEIQKNNLIMANLKM